MAGNGVGNDKLTTPQRRAISALLSSRSVEEAAKTVIDSMLKLRELRNVEERLARLEAIMGGEG